jgi:hypothetical protein
MRSTIIFPEIWGIRPWLFIPENLTKKLEEGLKKIKETAGQLNFEPEVTSLERVQPWKYCTWNRRTEKQEPASNPEEMRSLGSSELNA